MTLRRARVSGRLPMRATAFAPKLKSTRLVTVADCSYDECFPPAVIVVKQSAQLIPFTEKVSGSSINKHGGAASCRAISLQTAPARGESSRRSLTQPLLIGDAGAGKSTTAQEWQYRMTEAIVGRGEAAVWTRLPMELRAPDLRKRIVSVLRTAPSVAPLDLAA